MSWVGAFRRWSGTGSLRVSKTSPVAARNALSNNLRCKIQRIQARDDSIQIFRCNLHHSAELFTEQFFQACRGQRDIESNVPRKRHLEQRHKQAAVAAVVIRKQPSFVI